MGSVALLWSSFKRASSCLFHTKRQLAPRLVSIDIDCQSGSELVSGEGEGAFFV